MENYFGDLFEFVKGVKPGNPTATEIIGKMYGSLNVVSDKNGHLHVERPGRLTATEKAIIRGKWFRMKLVIGFSIMIAAGLLAAWGIYQMVLIHRFIMSL